MTTPENPSPDLPSLSGLGALNLGIALTNSFLMLPLITLVGDDGGFEKTALVFPFIVILLAVTTATISIWHTSIADSREGLKKGIGLTSWILTFVTLGFGFIALVLMVVTVFRL
ncbi:MAG: hypothetical protein F4X27_13410 [Chloroflexi bacterium]|nr:hypothetical protein [Chloroflexota bacterium]